MVHLLLLARLQVWMRQGVMCGWSTQQFLRAATIQAVLTAIRGPNSLGGATQTTTLPTKGAPSGTGSLTDSAARDHWVILPGTEMKTRLQRRATVYHRCNKHGNAAQTVFS